MKTIQDLFELLGHVTAQNKCESRTWFFRFYGHVNKVEVEYYRTGWKRDAYSQKIEEELTEDGIQAAYWFVKSRL